MIRTLRSLILAGLFAVGSLGVGMVATASAHSDACHTWHACPWDSDARTADGRPVAEYTCGDLGYDYWCNVPIVADEDGNPMYVQPHTTLVDFQPPPSPLTPAIPPPPAPPRANPAGVLTPIQPPQPPIQLDCSKDALAPDTRAAITTTPNNPGIQQGCLTPITAPPLHP